MVLFEYQNDYPNTIELYESDHLRNIAHMHTRNNKIKTASDKYAEEFI